MSELRAESSLPDNKVLLLFAFRRCPQWVQHTVLLPKSSFRGTELLFSLFLLLVHHCGWKAPYKLEGQFNSQDKLSIKYVLD